MTRLTNNIAGFVIRYRNVFATMLLVATIVLAIFAMRIDVRTIFEDMLPQDHRWIETHEQFKETFGGANLVTIMVRVEEGEIFRPEVLEMVRQITRGLRKVSGVNQFQITSLASRKLKTVRATFDDIKTEPLMWPEVPQTEEELADLRESVLRNPVVYGRYVSPDLTATLISVDFIDRLLKPNVVFDEIRALVDEYRIPGVDVKIIGEPMLYGWVQHYLPQTALISVLTLSALAIALFLLLRSLRGTLLPLISGLFSAAWALGIAHLLGFNFDPLVVVVAFLIMARCISHSVQLVARFDDITDQESNLSVPQAARRSLAELLRPGTLGILSDAGAILVVFLTPIPLLQKISLIGAIWVGTVFVSALVLTPILLSLFVRAGHKMAHWLPLDRMIHKVLEAGVWIAYSRARYVMGAAALVVFAASGLYALNLEVGDARPGSPILWPDHPYNRGEAVITEKFRGSDRMYVVLDGKRNDVMKKPEVLRTMRRFQRYMEAQPEVGATTSLVDVIASINQALHEGNPRYYDIGRDRIQNGQYLYFYVAGSDPGDLQAYSDANFEDGAVTLYFTDRKGRTIRTAFRRIQEFIDANPLEEVEYRLAGGVIGVIAAVNDVLLQKQIQAIALALLVIVVCATAIYRSAVAGMFFMVPVLISNTVTFAYMAWNGIGMSISTIPVVALGIGVGVDYSFYVIDGIKAELERHENRYQALYNSMHGAGRAVAITGVTLVVSILIWGYSSLRFQAEMGLLIGLWLAVSAASALFLMPALAFVFKPKFIFGSRAETQASPASETLGSTA